MPVDEALEAGAFRHEIRLQPQVRSSHSRSTAPGFASPAPEKERSGVASSTTTKPAEPTKQAGPLGGAFNQRADQA